MNHDEIHHRHLPTILSVVANLTPKSETAIHEELASLKHTLEFLTLPENYQLYWRRLANAFNAVTNPPEADWQLAICTILNDEPLETIKTMVEEHNRTKHEF